MSRLTDFYRGAGTDAAGRTLAELWAYSDERLEEVHDFIQWLFPTPTPSRFNPNAPLLTEVDIAEFLADPILRANLLRSFEVYLAFLGLSYDAGRVEKAPDFDRKNVFQHPDHNWLRITRVLISTRLLGLDEASRAFFEFLKRVNDDGRSRVTPETFRYWDHACNGTLQVTIGLNRAPRV